MADDLIKPDETAFTLYLTAPQLKVLYTALKTYGDDLGHEESDIEDVVKGILAKLPSEETIRAIDLNPHA
ncbi:MAG TPA: hypothetical protein VMU39_30580 [Solirubrobacteraceae bacterium]|nr:hypothetical protein [Solirubrobacteraceae bacterium]